MTYILRQPQCNWHLTTDTSWFTAVSGTPWLITSFPCFLGDHRMSLFCRLQCRLNDLFPLNWPTSTYIPTCLTYTDLIQPIIRSEVEVNESPVSCESNLFETQSDSAHHYFGENSYFMSNESCYCSHCLAVSDLIPVIPAHVLSVFSWAVNIFLDYPLHTLTSWW